MAVNTGRGCWRAPTNPSFKIAEEPNTSRLGRDRRQFPLRRGVCIARRHRCLTELPTGRPSSTGPSHSRHCPLRRRKWEGRPVLIRLPLLAVHHSDITPPQPTTSPRQRPQQQCVTTAATGIYHITCTKHSSRSFASTFPIHSKEPAGSGRVPVVNLRERARQPLFSTGSLDKESIAHSSYPWMTSLSPWMGNFFFFSFPWTGLDFFLPVEGSVSVPGRLFSAHGWLFFNCAWMASFSVNR